MKNSILTMLFIATTAYAQTGKVGVNTSTPTETFTVKGTTKVEDLPKNGEGKIYNGTTAKNTVFKATRTVVADANGVLGYVDGLGGNSVVTLANIGSARGRYVQSGLMTDNQTMDISDSEITLNIPDDNSTAILNWVTSFARTTEGGQIVTTKVGSATNASSYIMRVSVVVKKDGRYHSSTEVAEEYFFQDAIPGGFSKTIPVKYVGKLNKGNYSFSLSARLEPYNRVGKAFYFTNTRVIGEGKIYK